MTGRLICFPFVGDSVGGSQISAATLINALDKRRYQPLVVLHQRGPLAEYLTERKISFETLPLAKFVGTGRNAFSQLGNLTAAAPVLWRFLRRHEILIVHTQDGRMNQTWGLPARLCGAGFVWHQRSKYAPSRLTCQAMRLANRIVCNSEFVRQGLPLLAGPKAAVVDNPFDTEVPPPNRSEARDQALAEIGLSEDGRIIAFVGNLTAQKRPEIFLRAAALISKGCRTPLRFLIFGRDREDLQPGLSSLAGELGIGGMVRFMGFRDPMAPWLAAADLLLASEVGDAFGRTLVEAMLMGTPVIASDSGGHREIIEAGTTGLLTVPDDALAMATAALSLLGDADYSDALSRRARKAAVARYAIPAHAAAMMDIYDQLPSAKH
jgi:glycosyltransferase involved in cell wall biosynthesis